MSGKTSGKTVKEQLLEKLTPRELVTAAMKGLARHNVLKMAKEIERRNQEEEILKAKVSKGLDSNGVSKDI